MSMFKIISESAIANKIKSNKNINVIEGCTDKEINEAERSLNMKFPNEYKTILKEFGCIDFGACEWTGLNIKGHLNVVTATLKEKSVNKDFPEKHFVLEDFNIDAKKAIVNERGNVFIISRSNIKPAAGSISQFLEKRLKESM